MTFLSIRNTKFFILLIVLVFSFSAFSPIYILNSRFGPILNAFIENSERNENISKMKLNHSKVSSLENKTLLTSSPDDFNEWSRLTTMEKSYSTKYLSSFLTKKNTSFRKYYNSLKEIGRENSGLVGEMRAHIHLFSTLISKRNISKVKMLELRRREKDFLIRENEQSYEKYKIAYKQLRSEKLTKNEIKELESYNTIFSHIHKHTYEKNKQKELYSHNLKTYNLAFDKELIIRKISSTDTITVFRETIKLITYVIVISFIVMACLVAYVYHFLSKENKVKGRLLDEKLTLQEELIAQEKLASLGGLAAGIAHEIKNPLNIILNSAKIIESIFEDHPEYKKDETSDLSLVGESSKYILTHSKRADSIVKNMLNLSRGGSRQFSKENLSDLIIENYNLAYHSMRATDPFELTLINEIEPINDFNCIRTDLSQAIINLIDNSLYSLREKLKTNNYSPEIKLQLTQDSDSINLTIRDNGTGIPDDVRQKILEPFYTTKPPGQGTGLGLSFTTDVIKEHHGKIEIASDESSFTEIRINLKKGLHSDHTDSHSAS